MFKIVEKRCDAFSISLALLILLLIHQELVNGSLQNQYDIVIQEAGLNDIKIEGSSVQRKGISQTDSNFLNRLKSIWARIQSIEEKVHIASLEPRSGPIGGVSLFCE